MRKETICEISANMEDMSGEELAYLLDKATDAGVIDVWATPIVIGKGQPAYSITLLCHKKEAARFCELMFADSGIFDLRLETKSMLFLEQDTMYLQTSMGMVRVNRAGNKKHIEYDDLQRIARKENISISEARERIMGEINI